MSMAEPARRMTLDEFVAWEREQPTRHEFVDGEIVAMTGARARHVRMVARLVERLRLHLRGRPCEVLSNDMRVRTPRGDAFYPDLLVLCGEQRPGEDDDEVGDATVVIEVLSPSTAQLDDTRKRWGYLGLPSLAHYLLVDPVRQAVEVVTREPDGSGRSRLLTEADDAVDLPAIGWRVRLGDLYSDD
jgi:Uma2 family endonuclease